MLLRYEDPNPSRDYWVLKDELENYVPPRPPSRAAKSRRAAAGRAQLLAKSAHAGHLRLPAELLEVGENSGNSPVRVVGAHSRKFCEILGKFW